MIDIALKLISAEMNAANVANTTNGVVLANVADLEDPGANFEGDVLLTLVNIEEESTLKNLPAAIKTSNGSVEYRNPPIYLNLYLLFACNQANTHYDQALLQLSEVIRFLQGRRVFKLSSSSVFTPDREEIDFEDLELSLNLYTMTFEQINHLWGSLGGKQMPFVMYKARLVALDSRRPLGTGTLIEEINTLENADIS